MPLTALRPTLLGVLTPALALLLGLVPHGAEALGLGRPQVLSALGRPLDVSIPVTLADGEPLGDSCLRAEVTAGDARVPAGLLQLRIEGEPGQRNIRLQSMVRIEEPALRITLALGCPVRLTREFNAFVDPPNGVVASTPLPPAPPPQVAAVVPEPRALIEVQPAAPRPRPAAHAHTHARARANGPRLVLERPEVLATQASPPAPASAPEAELTPELEAQISQLEQTVAQLRAELEARQAASAPVAAAPASIPAAPPPPPAVAAPVHASAYRDPMTWLMTLALSLLAGSAAFYGSRWLDQRARRESAYWRSLQAAAEGAAPPPPPSAPVQATGMAPPVELAAAALLPDEGQHAATRPQPRPMAWPPPQMAVPAPAVAPDSAMLATQPMPVQAAVAPPAPVLSVADDLLDLQQQVDFLLLLGQHEAAAELLAGRLTRGASSAMPYLMLMELCQQRGEPEVFAELVKQFEPRFRTLAPSWSQSLARGRSLDACPSVIAHLQVVWAEPGAAMQMLQALLAKGGGPGVQSFDLPAYRDLLTLYSVARDLFEAGLRSDDVDLMLPIESQFGGS
jgi:pilus assembly protein FimV